MAIFRRNPQPPNGDVECRNGDSEHLASSRAAATGNVKKKIRAKFKKNIRALARNFADSEN